MSDFAVASAMDRQTDELRKINKTLEKLITALEQK